MSLYSTDFKLSALQLSLYSTDFKLSALQLKSRCKIHSTLRPSNHNGKNIRLHVKTTEKKNILSLATAQFTTAKTIWTNVSLNTSSRAQKVCAWNSANPGLPDRNNRRVKCTQPWNTAGHNCRNRLRFCANVLSITSLSPAGVRLECRIS